MQCPNCLKQMQLIHRYDVEVDLCPTCKGVWLERGEKVLQLCPLGIWSKEWKENKLFCLKDSWHLVNLQTMYTRPDFFMIICEVSKGFNSKSFQHKN